MKKVLIVIAIIIVIITAIFLYNNVYSNYIYIVKNNEISILKFLGNDLEDIQIPSKIKGKKVTKISKGAFKNNKNIKTVCLPEGITEIGEKAFIGCENLEYIKILGVEPKIYSNTFDNGTVIKHVYMDNGYIDDVWKNVVLQEFNIPAEAVVVKEINDCVYEKYKINPIIKVTYKDKELTENDYNLEVINSQNVGTATAIINLKGDYIGKIEKNFKIVQKDIKELKFISPTDVYYTGANVNKKVDIKHDGVNLIEGQDYKLTYKNNKNVGTAKIIIDGIGNYKGTKELTFKIKSVSINDVKISGITSKGYTGKAVKLSLQLKIGNNVLKTNQDYTVEYKNNIKIGTATVTIKGIKNVTGTITKSFNIVKTNISTLQFNKLKDLVYTGNELKPKVVIKQSGKQLIENVDYKLTYKNNKNIGTATIVVEGIGNYKGTKNLTFNIEKEKYYIKVNCQSNVVTIYKGAGENLTPVKAMVCSTGTATPKSGKYTIKSRWTWLKLIGGVYGHYVTQITGDILFHSVPYLKKSPDSLEYWEYDKLGTKASLGCVRLTTKDAKWIYNNIKKGTIVEFYNSSNPGPLGKPTAMKISSYEKYRNWDPTDDNKNNPWKEIL